MEKAVNFKIQVATGCASATLYSLAGYRGLLVHRWMRKKRIHTFER